MKETIAENYGGKSKCLMLFYILNAFQQPHASLHAGSLLYVSRQNKAPSSQNKSFCDFSNQQNIYATQHCQLNLILLHPLWLCQCKLYDLIVLLFRNLNHNVEADHSHARKNEKVKPSIRRQEKGSNVKG